MCVGNCVLLGLPCECAPRPAGGRPAFRPCGTMAAYRRHQRHGETPCRACKQAHARWWQETGRAQREARRERARQAARRAVLAEALREFDGYGRAAA